MCRRVAWRSSLRFAIALLIGMALLQVPCVAILVTAMGQNQGRGPRDQLQLRQQRESHLDHPGVERAAVAPVGQFWLEHTHHAVEFFGATVVGTANGTVLPVIR